MPMRSGNQESGNDKKQRSENGQMVGRNAEIDKEPHGRLEHGTVERFE